MQENEKKMHSKKRWMVVCATGAPVLIFIIMLYILNSDRAHIERYWRFDLFDGDIVGTYALRVDLERPSKGRLLRIYPQIANLCVFSSGEPSIVINIEQNTDGIAMKSISITDDISQESWTIFDESIAGERNYWYRIVSRGYEKVLSAEKNNILNEIRRLLESDDEAQSDYGDLSDNIFNYLENFTPPMPPPYIHSLRNVEKEIYGFRSKYMGKLPDQNSLLSFLTSELPNDLSALRSIVEMMEHEADAEN